MRLAGDVPVVSVSARPDIRRDVKIRWLPVTLYVALIVLGAGLGRHLVEAVWPMVHFGSASSLHWIIAAAVIAYAIVLAVPFVPAAEMGLVLLVACGPSVALVVYLGTVTALTLDYLIARALPPDVCARALGRLGLHRSGELVRRLAGRDTDARLETLLAHAPPRVVPLLLRQRYLALAVALNLPGNTLLGGGGGIALFAGLSGMYPLHGFVVAVAIAVAPLPMAFALFI